MASYTGQSVDKVEADTDRDYYMSPIEAKEYGMIDHVIGGDDAGYSIAGSLTDFPRTNPKFLQDEDEDDPDGTRGSRFRRATEPYVMPLAPADYGREDESGDEEDKKE